MTNEKTENTRPADKSWKEKLGFHEGPEEYNMLKEKNGKVVNAVRRAAYQYKDRIWPAYLEISWSACSS